MNSFSLKGNKRQPEPAGSTVSVIIATYNRPKQLHRAIVSALGQTHPVLEILVCEDGRTNVCADIVRSFDDPRIRHLPGSWTGMPAVPRNRGLLEAKGFWIGFLDDDDSWHPEKVKLQLQEAHRHNRGFIATAYTITQHNKKNRFSHHSFSEFLRGNPVALSSVLVQRHLITSGFSENPKLRGLEDFHLWLQVATRNPCLRLESLLIDYCDASIDSVRRLHCPRTGAEELKAVLVAFLSQHPNQVHLPLRAVLATRLRLVHIRMQGIVEQLLNQIWSR